MNIVLAGHLDRAFQLGLNRDHFRAPPRGAPLLRAGADDPYRSLFHRAGMIALLSEGIVSFPDLPPPAVATPLRHNADGRVEEAIGLAELEADARIFARLLVGLGAFSPETAATMCLRARVDPHAPDLVHHVEDVLVPTLHAWRARATLVVSSGDGRVLSESVACALAHGIALPFGLPDLRRIDETDTRAGGALANLEPGDVGDLDALLDAPAIRAYHAGLRRVPEGRRVNQGALLATALRAACGADPRLAVAPADIRVTTYRARVFGSADLRAVEHDPHG